MPMADPATSSACDRFCTPSFRYTFARCVLAVSVEMPVTDAMADVVRPVAAMRSTAISRRCQRSALTGHELTAGFLESGRIHIQERGRGSGTGPDG